MARTAMLDFNVPTSQISEEGQRTVLLKELTSFFSKIDLLPQSDLIQISKGYVVVFSKPDTETSAIIRLYQNGLVSIMIEEFEHADLTNGKLEVLRKELVSIFSTKVEKTPTFKHALDVPVYFNTSDDKIREYDFDRVVFEKDSKYQNVKILSSPSLGNCLILDDLQNLGDCDIAYTQGIMKFGEISYKDKEVFIMGGGDGGLLHELLKEDPKFVTMVDIDEVVIDACREHLRGTCGDSMDKLEGPNYHIIVDDCLKIMDQYIAEGRKFDYVFNDLTDIPISTDLKEETWEFTKKFLIRGLQLLRPSGSYLNHAIGVTCKESLAKYEELLQSLPLKLEFSSHTAYVPSFIETWVFYEVRIMSEA